MNDDIQWYVLKSPYLTLSVRDDLKKVGLEHFLPTHMVLLNTAGRKARVEKPLALNMVFVRTDFKTLLAFKNEHADRRLHVVYTHPTGQQKGDFAPPLTVPDRQMNMFINAVGIYRDAEIPYMKPTEIDLEKGDIVRIVAGPFTGIEGVLISQQGKDGGRVLVNVSNVIAVPTLHIEPEYLQVLQFAKKGKHFYKLIDSYIPRLKRAMEEPADHRKPSTLDPVRVFANRFCCLQADTLNADAKVQALLLASYRLLGEDTKAAEVQQRLDALRPRIKSANTLDFIKEYT